MIRKVLLAIILLSCNRGSEFNLKDVDKIKIKDISEGVSWIETNQKVIQGFKEVLKGKAEEMNCKPDGSILFLNENKTELKVDYSINPPDCVFLILRKGLKQIGYRLNYRSGMYLSEYIYELKRR